MEEGSQVDDGESFQKLIETLPKERNWDTYLYKYQNFWCPSIVFKAVVSSQKQFQALDTDILLLSLPKSGTTWLKSIVFSICNRHVFKVEDSPLQSCGPHELILFLEFDLYVKNETPDITNIAPPSVFATHVPYDSLPPSLRTSKCKIVYVCRNPLDAFVSYWHFMKKIKSKDSVVLSFEEVFEMFCQGIHGFGPFWDHILGYWKASTQTPDKLFFMKYEEMKKEPTFYTKKIAQFIGLPFTNEEENEGNVDDIVKLCSFHNMKNVEANKKGEHSLGLPNSAFFRKGDVGDGIKFLKPNEVLQLDRIIQEKLNNFGLSFNMDVHL